MTVNAMGAQVSKVVAQAIGAGKEELKAVRRRVVRTYPLGRVGATDDRARAVVYQAFNVNSFVTGAALAVDGGFIALQASIRPSVRPRPFRQMPCQFLRLHPTISWAQTSGSSNRSCQ